MLNIAFLFGTISGLIVIGAILAGLTIGETHPHAASEWFGYLVMIVALSMIFFGIKRYRDHELGGVIKFVPAFLMGLSIAAIAGVIYVAVWEVYLAATDYKFMDVYTTAMIEAKRAKGVTGAELETALQQVEWMKAVYANPLSRMAITFIEIFPVGLIIALISALILRNPRALPAQT